MHSAMLGREPVGRVGHPSPPYTAAPVNPALLALAGIVALAAVVATSARDGRVATIGLVGTLALGPLIADPLPDALAVASRIAAAALVGYMLRIALRDAPIGRGSRIGWPAESIAAGAAFAAGGGAHAFATAGIGPVAAVAAGSALVALAIAPLADGRDPLRLGTGLLLLVAGADLVRVGFAGTPTALEELVVSGAAAAVGAAVAVLAIGAAQAAGPIEAGRSAHGRRTA